MSEKNIYQILSEIQSKFVVKKDKENDFGKFNYRTAEGILSEVKSFLEKYNICISLKEEILSISNRFYIKSTATLFKNKDEFIEVFAFAREPEGKKGMDEAQITGGTTSYARKYALCGLLAISEDIDDPDTKDNQKEVKKEPIKSDNKDNQKEVKKEPIKLDFEIAKASILKITNIEKLEEVKQKIIDSNKYSLKEKEELINIINCKN